MDVPPQVLFSVLTTGTAYRYLLPQSPGAADVAGPAKDAGRPLHNVIGPLEPVDGSTGDFQFDSATRHIYVPPPMIASSG
jgi:hypothetical protein